MKKASFLLLFAAGCLVLLNSCNDIIAKDITDDVTTVILPQANEAVAANPVHFKWNEIEGATKYHLEVVSPSFNNITDYELDSIVTGTNFFFALDSNNYEFRITALNAGYESQTSSPIPFSVGTSSGAPSTAVVLDLPDDAYYENEGFDGKFKWHALSGADHYTFELHKGTTFSDQTIDIQYDIESWTVTSDDGPTLAEGEYVWGVKAYMTDGTETVFTKRTLYIDKTTPGVPVMTAPFSNQAIYLSQGSTIVFSWTLPQETGAAEAQSPITSTIEFSHTSNFATIVYAADTHEPTKSIDFPGSSLGAGTYYWRVRLKDDAGHEGTNPTTGFLLNVNP